MDNGGEFASLTADFRTIDIYYCHPYASFNRCTNEKENSLIRRFIPKGASITEYSVEAIQAVESWINDLLSALFDFVTSKEKFTQEIQMLAA